MTLAVPHLSEMQRILALPRAAPLTPEAREALSREVISAKPFEGRCLCGKATCTTSDRRGHVLPDEWVCPCREPGCRNLEPHPKPLRLLPGQADGLAAFRAQGGGFMRVKVGGGKTALAILIADHFFRLHYKGQDRPRILLLIPPSVYQQFWIRDKTWAYDHLNICVPFVGLGNCTAKKRRDQSRRRWPGVYVLPYSCLSTEDTIEVLREIDADLVIADEGQEIADGDSAKAKRWWGYAEHRKPQPAGVVMTATPTTRSPMDYHKPMRWSLGDSSPLPRTIVEATKWAEILRSRKEDEPPPDPEILRPLCEWAGTEVTPAGARAAYRQRLTSVPGFVDSGDDSLGIPIEIVNTPACDPATLPGGMRLLDMIYQLEVDDIGPNGDILKYGVEKYYAMEELTLGFYNRRYWPEEHPLVGAAKAHFAADQEYAKELNKFFRSTKLPREGLDTPMAVGKWHSIKGAVRGWEHLYEMWDRVRSLTVEGMPERLSEPVRVCDYKIRHAVEWVRNMRRQRATGGILWCFHRGVADWVFESLTSLGFQSILKGGGAEWLENDGSERYWCVASIEAHHKGKNLQHHRNQLLVQWPRSADYAEQLLGRLHRTGQAAAKLVVHTNLTTDWDYAQRAATLADTRYDQETIGGERKLLIADWSPPLDQGR